MGTSGTKSAIVDLAVTLTHQRSIQDQGEPTLLLQTLTAFKSRLSSSINSQVNQQPAANSAQGGMLASVFAQQHQSAFIEQNRKTLKAYTVSQMMPEPRDALNPEEEASEKPAEVKAEQVVEA